MRACLQQANRLSVHLISGETGSGKGLLLEQLAAQEAQVIDVEGLTLTLTLTLTLIGR